MTPDCLLLDFEQIEDCFPEGLCVNEDASDVAVPNLQWMHDFARAIEQRVWEKLKLVGYVDEGATARVKPVTDHDIEWIRMGGLELLYAAKMPPWSNKG